MAETISEVSITEEKNRGKRKKKRSLVSVNLAFYDSLLCLQITKLIVCLSIVLFCRFVDLICLLDS